ncbi:MAG TPA: hypothetical protein VEI96_05705 [Thermodesulfovibrionales bacterium]|nr:hypothetical protein [Thermodesulfovibrionales bacterium]
MGELKIPHFVLILVAVVSSVGLMRGTPTPVSVGVAFAQEAWLQEFNDICAKTEETAMLSSDDLKNLVARCDALKPLIDKLPETQKKVYLKRLHSCRDFYVFALESKSDK